METIPTFDFKTSQIFSPCEMAELYKIYKTVDDNNNGMISYKEIEEFLETMYNKDNFTFSADDIMLVNSKFKDVQR